MEMQAILVELIEKFEFQPVEGVDIMRVPAGAMIPMVRGKMQEGSQMPLYISAVAWRLDRKFKAENRTYLDRHCLYYGLNLVELQLIYRNDNDRRPYAGIT